MQRFPENKRFTSAVKVMALCFFATSFFIFYSMVVSQKANAMDWLQMPDVTLNKGVMLFEDSKEPGDIIFVNGDGDSKTIKGAKNFVENMGERALSFLANESYSNDRKAREFKKLLEDSFDMKTIGRFAMGRHWRDASDSQKSEYLKLFEAMVVDVYTRRFDEYSGQAFRVGAARADGKRDTIVSSFITSEDGPEVQVDWRVRYKKNKYQVVDVIVEGVSMSVTQRSEFSTLIQRGGGDVDVLISHLKERT